MQSETFAPKILRMKDAPYYMGMNKNMFNDIVRPFVTEIPIGKQGIGFDRLELDMFADDNKRRVGRPGSQMKERSLWQKSQQVLQEKRATVSGISIKSSKEKDFMKALEVVASKKRSAI